MNVRSWPMGWIAQLPAGCFGRRFPIVFSMELSAAATTYYISELALPETSMLWELWAYIYTDISVYTDVSVQLNLKLGDKLPAGDAECGALEELLPGLDARNAVGGMIHRNLHLTRLRLPLAASGRRVVLRVNTGAAHKTWVIVGLIFSSVPTEVPDCLLPGQVKSQS